MRPSLDAGARGADKREVQVGAAEQSAPQALAPGAGFALPGPPHPPDEVARNAAVLACGVVDAPRVPELQNAAERTAAICQAPIALVTMVAGERQWIAGSVGSEHTEMPRHISFCAHAILSPELTLVGDALADPRFATHPMVVGPPGLRFVAAAPIIDRDGFRLGTVCAYDVRPRDLRPGVLAALSAIAHEVATLLELRRADLELRAVEQALAGQRAMNDAIVVAALDAIVTIDAGGRILEFNPAAEAMFGYARDEALGAEMAELIVPQRLRARHRAGLARMVAAGQSRILNTRVEIDAIRRDGGEFPIELTVTQLAAQPALFSGHIRDLTERKRAQADQLRLAAIVQSTQDAVVGLDCDRLVTHWNRGAEELYGYSAAEMTGGPLTAIVPADRMAELERALDQVLHHGRVQRIDSRRVTKDGRELEVAITFSPIIGDGRLLGVSSIGRDISERRRFEATLRHEAEHDPLTGLVNRRVFQTRLEQVIAPGGGERGAVVFIDLDHFQLVNDSLGHRAGDELIRAAGEMLRAGVREGDTVARVGGDEFAVLLPGCPGDRAVDVAEQLIARIAAVSGSQDGASAGVAEIVAGSSAEDVMAAADMALYDAKAAGGRRAVHHRDRGTSTLQGVAEVRDAIAAGRLTLYAQPIVQLAGGAVDSYELLVRMLGADGALIPPDQFIPIAERFGLIEQIDRWVLTRACELAADGMNVAVNLSAHTVANPETMSLVCERIEAGVLARRLSFEITETAALYDLASAREFALRLTAMGCGLALDDFGTGFGSLLHLKHLPVTQLKIDREFVAHLTTAPTDRHIIEALVGIAGALNVRTVAEGVEDAATMALLRDLGIDLAQGYHIARPAPVDTITV